MRPEILFPLFAPVTTLKGVGARVAPLLEKLAGPIVRDVLFLAPHSLIKRREATVVDAVEGEVQTFRVEIDAYQVPRSAQQPWKIKTFDGTGTLDLIFFGSFGGQLQAKHPVGSKRLVSGKVERFGLTLQIAHPDYMLPLDKADEIPEVEPIYPATAGLPARTVRKFALEALSRAPDLPEWQDPAWIKQEGFPSWKEALTRLHAPFTEAHLLPQAAHIRRLA
ncbi:MAG: ATP-dependent DNA helicase RecG, partial [Pseudomonadota bacterium]